ncbi:thiamine diphosphokinase [Bacillus carboniphilus]|uniref:Thiamine diphosphokinase n=1 Tax=Bacillus carboniphilus TaxID=86663 RepID=A0ABP3G1V7_9BACI
MIIAMMAGGPVDSIPSKEVLNDLPTDTVWIGIDRGTLTLFDYGIIPEYAVGDFDSVQEEEMQLIDQNVRFLKTAQAEKDETDMELAINLALEQKPSKLFIFGATGKRQDHQLANTYLLVKVRKEQPDCDVEIIDRWNRISVYGPGEFTVQRSEIPYISYIPLTPEVTGLTLTGFKYPLKDRHIFLGSTLCISNELIKPAGTFSFISGILMMIRSMD